MTITINEQLRKKIRIASARADMEPNEWVRAVVSEAATRTYEKLYPEEG